MTTQLSLHAVLLADAVQDVGNLLVVEALHAFVASCEGSPVNVSLTHCLASCSVNLDASSLPTWLNKFFWRYSVVSQALAFFECNEVVCVSLFGNCECNTVNVFAKLYRSACSTPGVTTTPW
jgi:hypothetical protein